MANKSWFILLSILGWTLVTIFALWSLIALLAFPDLLGIKITDLDWYNLIFSFASPIVGVYLIVKYICKYKITKQNKKETLQKEKARPKNATERVQTSQWQIEKKYAVINSINQMTDFLKDDIFLIRDSPINREIFEAETLADVIEIYNETNVKIVWANIDKKLDDIQLIEGMEKRGCFLIKYGNLVKYIPLGYYKNKTEDIKRLEIALKYEL